MNPNWAAENLQTIRTLMERSALYRRALAPIMTVVGLLGLLAAVLGWVLRYNSFTEFATLWNGTAFTAIGAGFLIARRQAIKEREPFMSPPTRRIIQAMLPPLLAGAMVTIYAVLNNPPRSQSSEWWPVVLLWLLLYGCGLHAAGFFTPKGVRWLAWFYLAISPVIMGIIYLAAKCCEMSFAPNFHFVMGTLFGGPHLAYGIYLHFTEKQSAP